MRMKTLVVAALCVLLLNTGLALGSPKPHRVASATVVRETTAQPLSIVVMDPATSTILYQEHAYDQRAIASITKVMTALVFLDMGPDLLETVTVTRADTLRASTTKLRVNDRVTVDDLLHLMLIASDNVAARVLARLGGVDFIERMNAKAQTLGLWQTTYADSSGLLADNQSTAYDMARLMTIAAQDAYLTNIMQTATYTVRTPKRLIAFHSTDHLLTSDDVQITAAKTGYIGSSGYCFAALLHLPGHAPMAIVVLGARSNPDRFDKAHQLLHLLTELSDRNYRVGIVYRIRVDGTVCGEYPTSVSDVGIDFIKRLEGFHTTAYHDSQGYAIGYGMHTWLDRPVTKYYPVYVTQGMADLEFGRQLAKYQEIVEKTVCAALNQSAYDSLVSVAYNLGHINPDIVMRIHAQQKPTIKDFLKTATVHNRPNAILRQRRTQEFIMFISQDSTD
jgi:D-alanyl-D-alanine endopeptidase (penicillin-binding protein 7)